VKVFDLAQLAFRRFDDHQAFAFGASMNVSRTTSPSVSTRR
jgi:hypothetical protein